MIEGIVVLGVIYILYLLLVKGWLFKLTFFIFGGFAMYFWLDTRFQGLHKEGIHGGGHFFSWSMVIPIVLGLLVLAYTKED